MVKKRDKLARPAGIPSSEVTAPNRLRGRASDRISADGKCRLRKAS